MTFYISESAPARRLSASVVLDKQGRHVATVRTLYPSDGAGRVRVEVQHTALGVELCTKAPRCWEMIKAHKEQDYKTAAYDLFSMQRASTGGYGYDKRTAALTGLTVAGHTLANHCGSVPEAETLKDRLFKAYQRDPQARHADAWDKAAHRIGARWANYRDGRYTSLHFESGLDRLEMLGFSVISVI